MNHPSMSVDCDEVIELVIVLVTLLIFNVPKKHRTQRRTLCVRFGCGILMPQNFKTIDQANWFMYSFKENGISRSLALYQIKF